MKLIKRKSKKNTWKDKNGNEHPYYNYSIESDNGKRIAIRPVNNSDYDKLDMIAEYERA